MLKEEQIIEMIGDVAVQSTEHFLELSGLVTRLDSQLSDRITELDTRLTGAVLKLSDRISDLDIRVDRVEDSLRTEMREIRNENATFHDEIIGYLKRAEQERVFTSEHLRRLDEQVEELQRVK